MKNKKQQQHEKIHFLEQQLKDSKDRTSFFESIMDERDKKIIQLEKERDTYLKLYQAERDNLEMFLKLAKLIIEKTEKY